MARFYRFRIRILQSPRCHSQNRSNYNAKRRKGVDKLHSDRSYCARAQNAQGVAVHTSRKLQTLCSYLRFQPLNFADAVI